MLNLKRRPIAVSRSRALHLAYLEMPATPRSCPSVGHGAQTVLGVNHRSDLRVTLRREAFYARPRVDDATMHRREAVTDPIGRRERGDAEEVDHRRTFLHRIQHRTSLIRKIDIDSLALRIACDTLRDMKSATQNDLPDYGPGCIVIDVRRPEYVERLDAAYARAMGDESATYQDARMYANDDGFLVICSDRRASYERASMVLDGCSPAVPSSRS